MNESPDSLPLRDQELALHRRLVEGDPTAPSDLAQTYLDHLIGWLTTRNRRREEHSCITAAEDAVLALAKKPQTYDPTRLSLVAYLHMSAQGDLKNILRREGRHHWNLASLEGVELCPDAGKYLAVDDDPSLPLVGQEESALATKQVVAPARAGLTEPESRALDLMLQGERKTPVFAAALGISHLPVDVQRADVKRVKDKLKKRIEREASGDAKPS
jgi:DNA-directed RNA polymerase specialized sigma24 family protein